MNQMKEGGEVGGGKHVLGIWEEGETAWPVQGIKQVSVCLNHRTQEKKLSNKKLGYSGVNKGQIL